MHKLIYLSTICLVFMGCSVNETPEFKGVKNIKVLESNAKYITFTADAFFLNPNDIGGELQTDEIKVFINNNEMASVSTKSFKVPAKKDFSVPLITKVSTDSIFSSKSIGGLLGSLFSKKLKVQYKGDIKYKVLGFSRQYTINQTEEVNIKF